MVALASLLRSGWRAAWSTEPGKEIERVRSSKRKMELQNVENQLSSAERPE